MKITSIFILLFSTILIMGCSDEKKTNEKTNEVPVKSEKIDSQSDKTDRVEDFETFNKMFHSDKNFQLSRIKFPIKGELRAAEEEISQWTEKNWQFLKRPVVLGTWKDVDMKHKLERTEKEVYEKIWMENAGFTMERKYQLINNEWFLVMYNEFSF